MLYRITMEISGDNFSPNEIVDHFDKNIIDRHINPTDANKHNPTGVYRQGSISFIHPLRFAGDKIDIYEEWYIDILEQHANLFVRHGVREVIFPLDIYYDGGQCGFEIFGMTGLRRISKVIADSDLQLALPVDVHLMSADEIDKWSNDLENQWGNYLLQR